MRRTALFISLFIALLTSAGAQALPIAGRYPSGHAALKSPSEAEATLLRGINAARRSSGLDALEWEPRLSAVAREHSADMAEHDYFNYDSPRLGSLIYRQHRAGSSAPNARYGIFRNNSLHGVLEQLKTDDRPLHLGRATRVGVGVFRKNLLQGYFVTLIFSEMHVTLQPFPTQPVPGKTYALRGRVDGGYRDTRVAITLPNGEVVEQPLPLDEDGRFDDRVAFDRGRGRYVVEIVGSNRMGPAVLSIMHCYAGVPYPEPDFARADDAAPKDLRRAERDMLDLVNAARRKAGLRAIRFDEELARVARLHSRDMVHNDFFAHISPTAGDLEARMNRAGLTARAFTENLANNRTLRGAHEGLMDSPAHRKNILDPHATRVGIGSVAQGDDAIMVTQNVAQDFLEHDTDDLVREFLEAVRDERRRLGRPKIRTDAKLTRIARENSRDMARRDSVTHDRAMALLKEARLPYAVQVGVVKSVEPVGPEQIPDGGSGTPPPLDAAMTRIGVAVVQGDLDSGEKPLYITVLVGKD